MRKRKAEKDEPVEALVTAVRTILKQPEKNAQRDPGEKGQACYYCAKEGHLKQDCPQASKWLPAPCPICKGPHQKRRFQGSDSQDNQDWRCPGVPRQAPVLIMPEELWVLITVGGTICQFAFGHWGNLLWAYWGPGPLSPQAASIMGLSGWAKHYYFSHPLSCNWDSAIFTGVSDCPRVSLTPFGEWYTEQGPCLCFHEYGTLPFSPIN